MDKPVKQSKVLLRSEEVAQQHLLTSQTDGKSKEITGYALKFNERSKKLGSFYEVISPTALNEVDLTDVKALVDHDYSKILGRTKANTLKLEVDTVGLKFTVQVPNTTYANDLYESVSRGDVNECSFGFNVDQKDRTAQTIQKLSDGSYLRTVNKISDLFEVSVVANPAYANTTAEIKRDLDRAVRDFETEKLQLELELLNF